MSSRDTILARIRESLGQERTPDAPTQTIENEGSHTVAPAGAPRHTGSEPAYRLQDEWDLEARIERFTEVVRDYKANVYRAPAAQAAGRIAAILKERSLERILVPAGFPSHWLPSGISTMDEDPSLDQLNASEGVLTTCTVAIAQTGTLVLDGSDGQGRRALSLIPDYHLCVVTSEQVVGLVPQAIRRLESSITAGRPLTFISGPSATSDIELNRVEGVHGPRSLDVLLLDG